MMSLAVIEMNSQVITMVTLDIIQCGMKEIRVRIYNSSVITLRALLVRNMTKCPVSICVAERATRCRNYIHTRGQMKIILEAVFKGYGVDVSAVDKALYV
jgi:hypothetical protein